MARFPRDFLTAREQSAILAICVLAAVGLLLGQLGGEVPFLQENAATPESLMAAVEDDKPVQIDIRTASREELMLLPGIGPKRAQDIIDYRSSHAFESVGDLVKIKGIGEKTLARMLPS
ncbi:MAG: ComEA family DNA-binding protein, partial [Candidatus Syntrophosphaera sp.]